MRQVSQRKESYKTKGISLVSFLQNLRQMLRLRLSVFIMMLFIFMIANCAILACLITPSRCVKYLNIQGQSMDETKMQSEIFKIRH